jgi:hypothetical protein
LISKELICDNVSIHTLRHVSNGRHYHCDERGDVPSALDGSDVVYFDKEYARKATKLSEKCGGRPRPLRCGPIWIAETRPS